jgi:hypothetical protein
MGKYAPLKTFLMEQGREQIQMTFAQIEDLLQLQLPASKRYPAWWSNNPSNNTMTREWLEAGYETESVDIAGERLVFRRVGRSSHLPAGSSETWSGSNKIEAGQRHPIFGCMKGTLTLLEDVDLTQPADPDWGRVYED